MVIRVSTEPRSSSTPRSACAMRRRPSKPNGLVTTATVSAPISEASEAITGTAPVPVPPPRPAVRKTMSAPSSSLEHPLGVFERRLAADLRVAAGAEALGELRAELQLDRRPALAQRLQVGVGGDELDAAQLGVDHPVDRVAAAAADADHLDVGRGGVDRVLASAGERLARCVLVVEENHGATPLFGRCVGPRLGLTAGPRTFRAGCPPCRAR